jgi:hypothetical protein
MEWRCTSTGIREVQRCRGLTRPAIAMRTVLRRRDTRYRGSLFGHAGVSYWSTDSIGILIGYLKRVVRVSLFRVISRRYDLLT